MTFDLHPLLQECSWGVKQGLDIVPCNTYMCASWVFLSALYLSVTYCPTFRACSTFMPVPYVPDCPWEGLGNMRHLCEWGTHSCSGAIICQVECINPSFLTFFQFGENTQWIMDGFALGRMCARHHGFSARVDYTFTVTLFLHIFQVSYSFTSVSCNTFTNS
jgi:hypothetical protein